MGTERFGWSGYSISEVNGRPDKDEWSEEGLYSPGNAVHTGD